MFAICRLSSYFSFVASSPRQPPARDAAFAICRGRSERRETEEGDAGQRQKTTVKLLNSKEQTDSLRRGPPGGGQNRYRRRASVARFGELPAAGHGGQGASRLPITAGYNGRTPPPAAPHSWSLEKERRLRLWPPGLRCFTQRRSSIRRRKPGRELRTQMANEPTYVDGGERPGMAAISITTTASISARRRADRRDRGDGRARRFGRNATAARAEGTPSHAVRRRVSARRSRLVLSARAIYSRSPGPQPRTSASR